MPAAEVGHRKTPQEALPSLTVVIFNMKKRRKRPSGSGIEKWNNKKAAEQTSKLKTKKPCNCS